MFVDAGPLLSLDAKYYVGSMFMLNGTREEIVDYIKGDPFYINGVWKTISINRYMTYEAIFSR